MPDRPATHEDLTALLDRARQERFRLLDLLKQSRAAVQDTAVPNTAAHNIAPTPHAPGPASDDPHPASDPAPTTTSQDLEPVVAKIQKLNDAVNARMQKLAAAETRIADKTERLERLELKLTNFVARFEALVSDAKESQRFLQPALDDAQARAGELRVITDNLQAHSHELARKIDERLADHTAEFEARLDDHHDRLATQQVAEHQSFADAVSRQKQTHLDQLHRELSEKRAELLEAYTQRRDELANRFKDEQQDALVDAEQAGLVQVGQLREKLSTMLDQTVGDAESRGQAALSQLREQIVQAMGRADDVHRKLKTRLDTSLNEHDAKVDAKLSQTDDDLLIRGQKLDERLAGLADLFDHQADQILGDLKGRANTMLDHMAASLDVPAKTARAARAPEPQPADENPQLRVA